VHFYLIGDKIQDRSVDNESFVRDNKLHDNVTILDSQSDIESYYKKFNIFVLSSISESCPNVLFEAMLAKCLCIVSEGSNSDHFIKDEINGFVYDGSTKMLEYKLIKAIELIKTGKMKEIIDNGYQYALRNFTLEKMVQGYESIYKSILTLWNLRKE
jgi:glycosyltransferase involved in cell wall biosynthesis